MRVLFICRLNSVRSPMAEGLLRKRLGNAAVVKSCGLTPDDPNDFMISIMNEVGIDMSNHQPVALADLKDENFDRIIAFTQDAKDGADAVFANNVPAIELWAVPNPGEGSLDVRALLNNYRAIRSNIDARLGREFR